MRRPSQTPSEGGKGDASLSSLSDPGRPADGGHGDAAHAAIADSDGRPSAGSDAAPSHDTDSSSSDAPGRTTSRCRPSAGIHRTRNGGNPDGAPRPKPRPRPGREPLRREILTSWGSTPDLPAVGEPVDRVAPAGFSILPPPHTALGALLRAEDDADLLKPQNAIKSPLSRPSQPPLTCPC